MSETRELYEIKHKIDHVVKVLERLATAAEKLAPQGDERELIALQLWTTLDVEAEASFRNADGWIAERNRQRAQAEANAQPPV